MLTVRIPWGTPYGYAEYTYDPASETKPDWRAVMASVKAIEDTYKAVFNGSAPSAPQAEPAPARPTPSGSLFCPDHPQVALVQSADKFQEWDEGPNGERIAAKFFCPGDKNGVGKNHSVWRSKAVTRAQ